MDPREELATLVALSTVYQTPINSSAIRSHIVENNTLENFHIQPTAVELKVAQEQVAKWEDNGYTVTCWFDDNYPAQLKSVHDFPPLIFTKGKLKTHDKGIAIIGSRVSTLESIEAAQELSRLVVESGFTVVSGLARGTDTAAHAKALEGGGRTVAVIGNGIDRYYPRENRQLQRKIEHEGLVLSQFMPGTPPGRFTFPMRNAVMSAYAAANIIVSATKHSGTRHQLRQAIKQSRPVVVTREVYDSADWAKEAVDDPSQAVAVADSPAEALHTAQTLIVQVSHP